MRKPLVSTSANISGQPSPINFTTISEEIKSKVDYIVQYRQDETPTPPPSSIIKLGVSGLIQIIKNKKATLSAAFLGSIFLFSYNTLANNTQLNFECLGSFVIT
jgi:tRNA A37 threonylcarbamoyladenosine synthetase subunit TsaC/SUA5/YrdC